MFEHDFGLILRVLQVEKLFCVETGENCVNNFFKWFSTVFGRLKPRLRVFSTNSLSRYNMTFRLFDISVCTRGHARDFHFYKSGA